MTNQAQPLPNFDAASLENSSLNFSNPPNVLTIFSDNLPVGEPRTLLEVYLMVRR
jgi:hypothetical protein